MPPRDSAFVPDGGDGGPAPTWKRAGLRASMRARVGAGRHGFVLDIEPMRIGDALRRWDQLAGAAAPRTRVLALDGPRHDHRRIIPARTRPAPRVVAVRLGIAVRARLDHRALVFGPAAVPDLISVGGLDGAAVSVLIDGPVEAGDARAIRRGVIAGEGVLGRELRALAAISNIGRWRLRVETRTRHGAAAVVAEGLRRHLAMVTGRTPAEIGLPDPRLVDRVLARTGHLLVRPIETEIYGGSIDVGIGTGGGDEPRPADTSLIYDLCGRSWHGD